MKKKKNKINDMLSTSVHLLEKVEGVRCRRGRRGGAASDSLSLCVCPNVAFGVAFHLACPI